MRPSSVSIVSAAYTSSGPSTTVLEVQQMICVGLWTSSIRTPTRTRSICYGYADAPCLSLSILLFGTVSRFPTSPVTMLLILSRTITSATIVAILSSTFSSSRSSRRSEGHSVGVERHASIWIMALGVRELAGWRAGEALFEKSQKWVEPSSL